MINKTNTLSQVRFGQSKRPTSLMDRVLLMLSLHRERNALRGLNAHLLDDIGLTRAATEAEAKRPVWDAPNRWLR